MTCENNIIINDSLDSLNADNAIRDFEKFIYTYNKKGGAFRGFGIGYCDWLTPDLQQITRKYLDRLIINIMDIGGI